MVWIDQKVVAKDHLNAAEVAIASVKSASPEVATALEELHAAAVALAKMAGVLMTD